MDEMLKQLIDMMKTLAPEIWAIYLKQIYVSTIMAWIWSGISLIIMGGSLYFVTKLVNKYSDTDDEGYIFISSLFVAIFVVMLIVLGINLDMAIRYGLNPEYYAIQLLLGR